MPAVHVAKHNGMCADTGRRIESEWSPSCFVVFSKNSVYTLFSFLSKCSTLYLVIIFCIIEYKNRCVRVKVPPICPDPGRHDIWLSPAAAETVSVLCPQLLCRILLTLFQNIRSHGFFGWNTIVVFSLSESRTASTSARNTQTVTDVMIRLFISCLQSYSFHICCLHKNLCSCVATFSFLFKAILRLYIK